MPVSSASSCAPKHVGTTTESTKGLSGSATPPARASSSAKPRLGVGTSRLQAEPSCALCVAGSQGASGSAAPLNLKSTEATGGAPSATRASPNQLSRSVTVVPARCGTSAHVVSLAQGDATPATYTLSSVAGTVPHGPHRQS